MLPTIAREGDAVVMIDQRKLPAQEIYVRCKTAAEVARAIKTMVIRGAPAIGVAAAMGIALGMRSSNTTGTQKLAAEFYKVCELMAATRPTAVNLFWAIDRMKHAFAAAAEAGAIGGPDQRSSRPRGSDDPRRRRRELPGDGRVRRRRRAGRRAHPDALQRRRARHGRLRHGARRHSGRRRAGQARHGVCRRDAAVSPGRAADGVGARARRHSDHGHHRQHGRRADAPGQVNFVVVGADRIAANGDTANKIGTYGVAVLAREHQIPFYVAAPLSTIDLKTPDGQHIPIEERNAREVTHVGGSQLVPDGALVWNPAFDVTPHQLIAGIITERGIFRPPYTESLARAFEHDAVRV